MTAHTLQDIDASRTHPYRVGFRTKVTVLVGVLVLATWGTVAYWTTEGFNAALVNESLTKVGHDAELAGVRLSTEIEGFAEDVRFLAATPPIQGIIRTQSSGGIDPLDQSTIQQWKDRLATILTGFMEAKSEYFQIRFIGVAQHGRELVRVDQPWGFLEQTPEANLQEIGDEPFFQDTIRLPRGTIYFSQITLNREQGEISSPLTPTLRIATPIYTPSEQVFGILIVNVNMSYLFSDMQRSLKTEQMLYVTNNEGEYLVHPETLKTFGFEFGESHKIQSSILDAEEWLMETSQRRRPFIHTNRQEESVIGLAKAQLDPENPKGYVIVGVHDSYHHVLRKANAAQQETLVLSVGLLCFALIGGLFLSRSIISPLKDFSRATTAVGRGEREVRFPVHSKDEVGQLAMAFNTMAIKIEERTVALERKEKQFREIVEAAPSGMIMVNQQGIITLCNQLIAQQFGYLREELVGQVIEILLPERYRLNHPEHRNSFFTTPEPRQMGQGRELYAQRKDGSEFPVEIGLNPLKTDDGYYVLASVVDITDRKHVQDVLQESEAKNRLIIESAPNGMVMVNQKNIITLVNEALTHQFGYTREELIGQSIECLVPEAFRAEHPRHCESFFASLQIREMGRGREVYARRKDGTQFHVEVALNPMTTEEGEFVLATVVDITERKEVEQRILTLHQRNELLLASAGEGIYGLDLEGKTTFVNPAAATMLGYAPEELIGLPMHATIHHTKLDGSAYSPEESPMYAAFKDGTVHQVGDELLWRKDGASFPVAYTSTPMRDNQGNLVGAVVTFSDISERKATEQALLKWNHALTISNQELDDFAYIASHDLKEPLRGIHNYSKILLEDHADVLNADAQQRCQTIIRLSRHMETLLDALLYFSRVGRSELAVGPIDLDSVLGDVLESLDIGLKERGVLVHVPQIFPTVVCDRTRVGEIFRNLITNAMKYNDKSERWIEIGYLEGQSDGALAQTSPVFFVRDNGIGIQEKHLNSIFRIFKRLHGRDKFGGGTGAGLTMTKKMIERHGGRIWVESIHGEGTTFYFTLEKSQVEEGAIGHVMAISGAVTS